MGWGTPGAASFLSLGKLSSSGLISFVTTVTFKSSFSYVFVAFKKKK
jgi:hypothetical protein